MIKRKIDTVQEVISHKGYYIEKTWLRDNKDRIFIPESERIPIVCKKCGYTKEITASYVYGQQKNSCFQCHVQEKLDERFGANHIKILEYGGAMHKLSRLYCITSEQVFERKINNMLNGNSSCICSSNGHRRHTRKEVKDIASRRGYKVLGNHKDEDIIGTREKLTLLCKKHGEFDTMLDILNQGCGCPKCGREAQAKKLRLTREKAQAKIDKIHGKINGKSRYVICDDYAGTNTECHVLCNKCGREREVRPDHIIYNGNRCPCEKESRGESFMSSFLDDMGLYYERQVKFEDCRNELPLPFDFKVYNSDGTWFLLEFDGSQHFESVEGWGGKEGLRMIQLRDRIKNEYCERNKIFLIRIQNKKCGFKPSDRERVIKALEKAGNIMAFLSEINRKHSWVITVEI